MSEKNINKTKVFIVGAFITFAFGVIGNFINNIINRKNEIILTTETKYQTAKGEWITQTIQQKVEISKLKERAKHGDSISKEIIKQNNILMFEKKGEDKKRNDLMDSVGDEKNKYLIDEENLKSLNKEESFVVEDKIKSIYKEKSELVEWDFSPDSLQNDQKDTIWFVPMLLR